MKNYSRKVQVLVEASIFAAIAIVLSLLPTNFGSSLTISLGMIPLVIISLRRGFSAGIFSGFIWGLLHFVVGNAYILDPLQGFIEYIIAFAFGGFAGLLYNKFKVKNHKQVNYLIIATFLGTIARFFWHFIAGFIYWGQYAPEGWSPVFFSLVFNGASAILTSIISSIVLVLIYHRHPRIFYAE